MDEAEIYPSVEKIKTWSEHALVEWLQTDLESLLSPEEEVTIKTARIVGRAFLLGAGNGEFFIRAGLSFGSSVVLADVAEKIVEKSKCCSPYHACCSDS
jgi:hypothetical protein